MVRIYLYNIIMKFECRKCEKEFEFLHLKNKNSKLYDLCDNCYEKETLEANSQFYFTNRSNKFEKPFYIAVISFVVLGGTYFCFTDGFSGNCDPAIDEYCANYKGINESN